MAKLSSFATTVFPSHRQELHFRSHPIFRGKYPGYKYRNKENPFSVLSLFLHCNHNPPPPLFERRFNFPTIVIEKFVPWLMTGIFFNHSSVSFTPCCLKDAYALHEPVAWIKTASSLFSWSCSSWAAFK